MSAPTPPKSSRLLLSLDQAAQIFRTDYGMTEEWIEAWRDQYSKPEQPAAPAPNLLAQNRPLALAKNGGLCVYCSAVADSVDHVIPQSKGGSHDLDNLVPACMTCNRSKKDRLDWKPRGQR